MSDKGMMIVANEGRDVLVSYNYMLRVEGVYDLPCKAVHSFTKENEFEFVQEGGLNDYVHMLRKPISKPFTFTVERYVGTDIYPPLPLGAELVLPVILLVAPHPNRFDIAKRTFVFTGCTVMGKTYGELNAERSGILTESIVIGYREMMEVTVPMVTGDGAQKWAFDGTKVQGNGKRSARENSVTEDAKKPKQRYWSMKKAVPPKAKTDGTTQPTAVPTTAETTDANRVHKASAKVYDNDKQRMTPRKWKKTKDEKTGVTTGGTKSAKKSGNLDQIKPKSRYWSMKGAPAPAQGDAATAATAQNADRSWKTSAVTNKTDSARATVRRWETADDKKLGGGTGSAKKNATDANKPKSRYWSIKGAPNPAQDDTADAANTAASTESAGRTWKASAITNKADHARATARQWEKANDKQLGGGKASAITNGIDGTKPTARQWEKAGDKKLGGGKASAITNKTDSDRATARQWETAGDKQLGGGTASAITNKTDSDRATARQWETAGDDQLGGGKASAISNGMDDKRATARQWETAGDEKLGGGKTSARLNDNDRQKATQRKWTMKDTANNRSAVVEAATKAEGRRWDTPEDNKLGGGKESARQAPSDQAKGRKWEMTTDAHGGGTASANQSPSTRANGRKWPAVSSARKRQE